MNSWDFLLKNGTRWVKPPTTDLDPRGSVVAHVDKESGEAWSKYLEIEVEHSLSGHVDLFPRFRTKNHRISDLWRVWNGFGRSKYLDIWIFRPKKQFRETPTRSLLGRSYHHYISSKVHLDFPPESDYKSVWKPCNPLNSMANSRRVIYMKN